MSQREPGSEGEERGGNPVVAWARAVVLGIKDTARDMVDEGRRGADEAYDEGWQRFDAKTKNRRKRG